MASMAKGAKTEGDQVSSLELPAPAGWKKFILKKSLTSQRSEIVFISPTGVEIRNKKHLGRHLRSNPGGPSSSEFDWGFGETPRRSARLIERTKETQPAEENSPKKRGRHLSSKKETEKKKGETDSDVEDEASEEEEPPKKQKRQSTSKKGTKQTKISADAMIEDEAPDKGKLSAQELEREEDGEMKDAEVGSVDEKEEAAVAAKAVTEVSFAEDLDDETKLKKDAVDAEVEDASENEKIATQVLDNPEVTDLKDAENVLVEGKEEASLIAFVDDSSDKVDYKDEGKNKKDVVVEVEQHEAPESVKIVATEVPENLEVPNMKDAGDASIKDKEEDAANAIMEDSLAKINSDYVTKQKRDDANADVEGKALKSENIAIQPLENIEDAEYCSINAKEEAAAKYIMQDSSVTVDSKEVNKQNKEVAAAAEDFHEEEIKKQTLLNNNRKGEQVSPYKAAPPTANYIDLKSPAKASAIV